MNTPNDGGPAFPVIHEVPPTEAGASKAVSVFPGMTLRDYFAAKAIPKALSMSEDFYDIAEKDGNFHKCAAQICYALADAMLAERKK